MSTCGAAGARYSLALSLPALHPCARKSRKDEKPTLESACAKRNECTSFAESAPRNYPIALMKSTFQAATRPRANFISHAVRLSVKTVRTFAGFLGRSLPTRMMSFMSMSISRGREDVVEMTGVVVPICNANLAKPMSPHKSKNVMCRTALSSIQQLRFQKRVSRHSHMTSDMTI